MQGKISTKNAMRIPSLFANPSDVIKSPSILGGDFCVTCIESHLFRDRWKP